MLFPTLYSRDFFDDIFDPHFFAPEVKTPGLMKTDVKENEDSYELICDLPGVKKEDVKAELKDGYLIVTATVGNEKEETDKKGKYIRKERYAGSCTRQYYVGDALEKEDIKAKYEDGVLTLTVPKKEKQPELPESNIIDIL